MTRINREMVPKIFGFTSYQLECSCCCALCVQASPKHKPLYDSRCSVHSVTETVKKSETVVSQYTRRQLYTMSVAVDLGQSHQVPIGDSAVTRRVCLVKWSVT